jgi:hypothetical protein
MISPMKRTLSSIAIAAIVAIVLASAPLAAQETAEAPGKLTLTSIDVQPAQPGPDTLCKLTVKVRNAGDRDASQLGFAVKLNNQDLTVYGNQLFMYPVPAGGELDIPLYNFWTTETSRPTMPADGKYRVEVSLLEAQWMDIHTVTEKVERAGEMVDEDVEVWTPLGPVEGLPVSTERVLAQAAN